VEEDPRMAIGQRIITEQASSAPTPMLKLPPAEEPEGELTRREWQVALLVGRGLINRHIAQELLISERTVHYHMRNIFRKLGIHSRARLASWVTKRQMNTPASD
jgi:non-specific serine/threonine protein kinase